MGAIDNYITELKGKIEQKKYEERCLTDVEILRIIYIDLGHKMNFDVRYSFGNSKQRKQIYSRSTSIEELNRAFETKTIICKSLAYIVKKILNEFGFQCNVIIETDEYGRSCIGSHVYNKITLSNGKSFTIDLEEDLEYIQTGSRTRYFGLINNKVTHEVFSYDEIKAIDTNIAEYIPEGYYLEDIIWMLEKALGDNISNEQRFDELLHNLNKYKDISKIGYRDRILYYQRMIDYFFGENTLKRKNANLTNKIELLNCYRMVGEEKEYVSCIITNFEKEQIYLFNDEKKSYEKIGIEDLIKEEQDGLVIPNRGIVKQLKRYKNSENSYMNREH